MATPIIRDFSTPVAPKQRVLDFVQGLNQQQPQQANPIDTALSPAQQLGLLRQGQQLPQSSAATGPGAVSMSAQRRTQAIADTNARLKATVDARKAQTPQTGAQGWNRGAGAGQAYRPDGSLSASRNSVLQQASSYIGTPYVLGGTSYKGIDCSGLVMMVYRSMGFNLRHDSNWQGKNIPGVRTAVQNLRPGDIVAWKNGHHIAIYAGNGMIIEAPEPGKAVRQRPITNYNSIYGIALRLPGE